MWTCFMDMHSGGSQKLDYHHIYIEASEYDAIEVFERIFGRDPGNVTCDCCGSDYATSESESLQQATGYERNCAYGKVGYIESARYDFKPLLSISDYIKQEGVKIIYANELNK